MIDVRPSEERGPANHGWLQSRHTFSFASYYDEKYMGVSALRVINDDKVAPSAGFSTHSHRDMEIISFVKNGTIEHKDSMGNIEILPAGEFQLMSAGTGVTHSEYNPSDTDSLEFLQIWIEPNVKDVKPGYQQKRFNDTTGLQLVVSPDGENGSLSVHQDAYLYHLRLKEGQNDQHAIEASRTVYIHIVSGSIEVEGITLTDGDGATIRDVNEINFNALKQSEALVFDLP